MYTCHDAYGGLALTTLYDGDRVGIIEPWVEHAILDPDDPEPEVLGALLASYAAIARERRVVDRDRARDANRDTGGIEGTASRWCAANQIIEARDELAVVINRIARAQGYRCCSVPRYEGREALEERALRIRCAVCGRDFGAVPFERVQRIVQGHDAV
jgi:hypothetical protein